MSILATDNEFISHMAWLFSRNNTRQSFLEQAVDCIKEYTDSECVGIRVLDKDGYIPYEAYLGYTLEFWQRENWLSVIEEKTYFRGACIDCGFETVASVQILFRETIVGVIHLADKRRDAFSLDRVSIIETIAPMIGAVINYDHLQNSFSRLRELHLVGEFAANLGHEVRNPLAAAHGMAQFLLRKKELEPYRDYLEMIISQLDLSNSILKEFLLLAKNKLVSRKSLDLNKLLTEVLNTIQPDAANRGVEVEFLAGDIPLIFADESEIKRLVYNLASNGLDAAGIGGILSIQTYREGNVVTLSVSDTGPGIEPSHFCQIGKPFFSTKHGKPGLGLSVCYAIAARNGADIDFKTDRNGATFLIHFSNKSK